MYILMDLYGTLLTEKQYNIMNMYYNDDLSLGEVAAQVGISRQGVHDTVKHCEKAMLEYEEKLGLFQAQQDHLAELKELKEQALDIFNECRKINLSRPIAEKTIVLLENLDSKLAEYEADYEEGAEGEQEDGKDQDSPADGTDQ
ncbi:MAG: YlxM family DNA-binding protein [Ruminococcus sp.]|nr:YlxM family DNA-binding protein [Ruminococcus sp.]